MSTHDVRSTHTMSTQDRTPDCTASARLDNTAAFEKFLKQPGLLNEGNKGGRLPGERCTLNLDYNLPKSEQDFCREGSINFNTKIFAQRNPPTSPTSHSDIYDYESHVNLKDWKAKFMDDGNSVDFYKPATDADSRAKPLPYDPLIPPNFSQSLTNGTFRFIKKPGDELYALPASCQNLWKVNGSIVGRNDQFERSRFLTKGFSYYLPSKRSERGRIPGRECELTVTFSSRETPGLVDEGKWQLRYLDDGQTVDLTESGKVYPIDRDNVYFTELLGKGKPRHFFRKLYDPDITRTSESVTVVVKGEMELEKQLEP